MDQNPYESPNSDPSESELAKSWIGELFLFTFGGAVFGLVVLSWFFPVPNLAPVFGGMLGFVACIGRKMLFPPR
ncbi:MAG TPA: hypothetical protein VHX65_04995 [Pirellulales bacterium]|jgi:hypothetical protein|nr:hypothetical protein [Pirellulales bacterium]